MQTTEEQKNQRKLLRRYLVRYLKAERKLRELRTRRSKIKNDLRNPLGTQVNDGLPHGSNKNEGAAAYIYRLAEIEDRIYKQAERAEAIMLEIMNVMDFLPVEDECRSVLELKYIDGKSEKEIMQMHFYSSRSTVNYHLNAGLDKLLEFKKIQKLIGQYEKNLED